MIKVVIAEDEPSILLSLEFLMKKAGYQVYIARDGAEARDIIDRELPHIVLLDIMIPGMNGYEVCQYIRSSPTLTNTRVVFLSAKNKDSDREYGYQIGADLYIPKPFSTRDLMTKINMLAVSVRQF
ncbi:response regulator transcription factor [Arundinibacter roseus]|nr:response regulator [Arundinibacter roseus]